jgi:GNAT superfamily N-acetyltransferase
MKETSTVAVVRRENPCTLDARILIDELAATRALYGARNTQSSFGADELCSVRSAFVMARTMDGLAIGCGALCRFSFEVAECRWIYRRPEWLGAGAVILLFLESVAAASGYRRIVLQARAANRCAIAFYRRHGYEPVEPFADSGSLSDVKSFAKALPLVPDSDSNGSAASRGL